MIKLKKWESFRFVNRTNKFVMPFSEKRFGRCYVDDWASSEAHAEIERLMKLICKGTGVPSHMIIPQSSYRSFAKAYSYAQHYSASLHTINKVVQSNAANLLGVSIDYASIDEGDSDDKA